MYTGPRDTAGEGARELTGVGAEKKGEMLMLICSMVNIGAAGDRKYMRNCKLRI